MISTNGTLRIKKIRQSRNGAFCVADLTTEFGEFKVKDPMLDQFEEGEYEGKVWISEIYLSQYIAYGKAVTEMRARLHDLQIHSEDQQPVRNEPAEIDPLDETSTPVAVETAQRFGTRRSKPKLLPPASSVSEPQQPDGLFDDDIVKAINAGSTVKLDPTVDRAHLRAQAAELRRIGYRFDPKQQAWQRS